MPEMLNRKLPGWQLLVDNLQPHLPELPQTAAYHAALAAVVEEGRALQAEQEICKAKLREVNQRRADLVLRGRDLRNRLAEGLRSALGVRNEKLVEFRHRAAHAEAPPEVSVEGRKSGSGGRARRPRQGPRRGEAGARRSQPAGRPRRGAVETQRKPLRTLPRRFLTPESVSDAKTPFCSV